MQLADQAAVAFTAARLVHQLEDLSWGALTALARTIDAKSPWTAGHSERVATLCRAIAEEMGVPDDQVETLQRAALLHDIGKIAIPAAVLDKAGALTAQERALLEKHVETGVRILEPIAAFAPLLPIIQDHHERLDGRGYPLGKTDAQIDPLGRILAVADVFDALVSERPYRAGVPEADVLRMLRKDAGTALDADVVAALGRMMSLRMVTDIPLISEEAARRVADEFVA
jgi:putative nucleotidyltransferase with HDIG domain